MTYTLQDSILHNAMEEMTATYVLFSLTGQTSASQYFYPLKYEKE